MAEPDEDFPKCSFCDASALDLPTYGKMIHSEINTDVWICESCVRTCYELLRDDESEEISN